MFAVCRSSPSQKTARVWVDPCPLELEAAAGRALAAAAALVLALGTFLEVLDEDGLARRAPARDDEEMCCLFALRERSSTATSSSLSFSESESTTVAVVSRCKSGRVRFSRSSRSRSSCARSERKPAAGRDAVVAGGCGWACGGLKAGVGPLCCFDSSIARLMSSSYCASSSSTLITSALWGRPPVSCKLSAIALIWTSHSMSINSVYETRISPRDICV